MNCFALFIFNSLLQVVEERKEIIAELDLYICFKINNFFVWYKDRIFPCLLSVCNTNQGAKICNKS